MKYQILNLREAVENGGQYLFHGDDGCIAISFYGDKIVRLCYEFDELDYPKDLELSERVLTPSLPSPVKALLDEDDTSFTLSAGSLRIIIAKDNAAVSVYYKGVLLHGGNIGNSDTVVPSSQVRGFSYGGRNLYARFNFPVAKNDEFYGLGDKTGAPDRRGRRFLMFNRDSLGYDASRTDPMYKSVPFFLKANTENRALAGIFIDAPLIDYVDFACESEFYYSWQVEGGPYSYFLIAGDDYHEILSGYASLTGYPYLPPLYSFGFFASSMNYADPDDSAERITKYFSKVEENDIPCEGLYFSSGYLRADDGKRYAFMWNRRKFPDVKVFVESFRKRGYHFCMNIKPGILKTHPLYDELAAKGYFIKNEEGQPYTDFFWGGEASLIDFMNPDAFAWWKNKLKEAYLDNGCSGIWNDNNEFEMENPEIDSYRIKTLLPVEMCRASAEAFEEFAPGKRGWIYSRSGYAGIQRYARTWSGDNVSDWVSYKNNQYMSVGFGLSGMPFYGHDLGGFYGDPPSEELLIRSCQSAVFQPRFVIHSWREDGNPTEPWTYPDALPHIRALIKEHYRFMPYIYSEAIKAAMTGVPIDRNLHLEYPDDESIRSDAVYSLFGASVVKFPVTEEGVASVSIVLPKKEKWFDGRTGEVVPSGVPFEVDAPLDGRAIWFAKAGSAIAVNPECTKLSGAFRRTDFLVFPAEEKCENDYFEDDGETMLSEGRYNHWKICVGRDHIGFTLVKKGLSAKGRLFSVDGRNSFDPDSLREGESIEFAIGKEA